LLAASTPNGKGWRIGGCGGIEGNVR